MDTTPLAVLVHAAAAFLVLVLGPVNIFRPRRDTFHRVLGRTWVGLMYLTCVSSFFFGLEDGFTALHGLSVFTTFTVTLGLFAIRRGHRALHVANMVGSYIGTFIAFGFAALLPSRLIWRTAATAPLDLFVFVSVLVVAALSWMFVLRRRLGSPHPGPAVPPPAPEVAVGVRQP